MARLAWLLLLLAAACSASDVSHVVGGNPISIEKYPSMVQLERLMFFSVWTQKCSGVILTASWILTVAQCVAEPVGVIEYHRIRAGSSIRNTGGLIRSVSRIINHPSFGENGFDGDISVMELVAPVIYSDYIAQGSIIAQSTAIPGNLPVTHAGWGRQSFSGSSSENLTEVNIRTVDNKLCAELYLNWPRPSVVTSNMICAGVSEVSEDGSCFGDAGGPLFFEGIVIGLASWGMTCANGTYPDVTTAVASYTDWIVATVD